VLVLLGAVLLAGAVLGFVPAVREHLAPPPPPDEERYGNGNWTWGLTIFLVPPGVLLAAAGAAVRRGLGPRWLAFAVLAALGGCWALGIA
jgi:hypothetical protein